MKMFHTFHTLFRSALPVCIAAVFFCLCSCNKEQLKTTVFETEETLYLTEENTDSLHIQIRFDYPVQLTSAEVLAAVQHDLKEQLFGEAFVGMEPQQSLDAYVAMLKTEYKQNNLPIVAEWSDEMPRADGEEMPQLCEEQYIDGRLSAPVNNILGYCVERYIYTGGAHGYNFRLFRNYDVSTGKVFEESDLFAEGYEEPLRELIIAQLAQTEEPNPAGLLSQQGYFVQDIKPNNNFFLSEEGVTYVFNPYDIAPYSFGESEILLTWDKLEDILKNKI